MKNKDDIDILEQIAKPLLYVFFLCMIICLPIIISGKIKEFKEKYTYNQVEMKLDVTDKYTKHEFAGRVSITKYYICTEIDNTKYDVQVSGYVYERVTIDSEMNFIAFADDEQIKYLELKDS